MKIQLNMPCALNEIGGGQRNEDSIFPEKGNATTGNRYFMVCDGIGGHRGGDVASQTVCRAFADFLKQTDLSNFDDTLFNQALDYAIEQLDNVESDDNGRRMGTTLTFICFHERGVLMAHIGDSRIYHLRKQGARVGILYKSSDHSLVNDLIRAEIITPEEARTHPKRNVITRALISRQETRPKADIRQTDDLLPGDCFFLCSDGVLEQVGDEALCYIIAQESDDSSKIQDIYNACQGLSHDNFSAYLISIAKVCDEPETATVGYSEATVIPPELHDAAGTYPPPPPAKWPWNRFWIFMLLIALLIAGIAGIAAYKYVHKPPAQNERTDENRQNTNKPSHPPRNNPRKAGEQPKHPNNENPSDTDAMKDSTVHKQGAEETPPQQV